MSPVQSVSIAGDIADRAGVIQAVWESAVCSALLRRHGQARFTMVALVETRLRHEVLARQHVIASCRYGAFEIFWDPCYMLCACPYIGAG
jgi:hypothetical protein